MLPLRRHPASSPVDSPALPSQQRPGYPSGKTHELKRDNPTLPSQRGEHQPWSASDSGLPTLGKLVVCVLARLCLGPFSRERRQRALDIPPDPTDSDPENALPAMEQVDHLVVRGALEHRDTVTHQRHLGQVVDTARPEVLDSGSDLLQRDPGVNQPLDHLEDQDVAKAVQPLRSRARRTTDLRHYQTCTGPVVQLAVRDASSAAGDGSAEPQVTWQRREVTLEQQLLGLPPRAVPARTRWLNRKFGAVQCASTHLACNASLRLARGHNEMLRPTRRLPECIDLRCREASTKFPERNSTVGIT